MYNNHLLSHSPKARESLAVQVFMACFEVHKQAYYYCSSVNEIHFSLLQPTKNIYWQCMLPTHSARKPTIVYTHKKKMGTMRKHTTLLCTVHPPQTKTATLDKHACTHKRTQPFSQTNWKMSLRSLLWNSVHIVQPEHLLLCKGWGAPPSNFFSPFCCKAHCKLIRVHLCARLSDIPLKFPKFFHCWEMMLLYITTNNLTCCFGDMRSLLVQMPESTSTEQCNKNIKVNYFIIVCDSLCIKICHHLKHILM